MIKKTLLGGALGLVLMGLLFGRDAFSYVRTSVGWVKESVKERVPVEFQIERARKMIADLQPEVRRNMHLIAKEEVNIERLEKQIASLETRQQTARENVLRMKTDLDQGEQFISYGGHRYSADQVRADLASRFDRYKTTDETLANLHKVLNARRNSLNAARLQLDQMLKARQQLLADVESLEARQKMVEVAEATSDLNLDDSVLARTKQLVSDIETRIQVAERLMNAEFHFPEEIPVDDQSDNQNISQQIADYFGLGSDAEVHRLAESNL